MRHRFEDSCNMSILSWKLYRKINSSRTWSSRKEEFLSEITSLLSLNLNTQIIYFQFKDFHVPFMTLLSIAFKFFAKIMRGGCVFCCSNCISFNPTSHLKSDIQKVYLFSCYRPLFLNTFCRCFLIFSTCGPLQFLKIDSPSFLYKPMFFLTYCRPNKFIKNIPLSSYT